MTAICPYCKAKIDYLKNYASGEHYYIFDGENYDSHEFEPNNLTNDYECPECHEVLFTDEDGAREFLLGEKNEG